MHDILERYINCKNNVQEEKVESKDSYLCLESDDSRRKMTDRKIIQSTADLSQSCLSREEQEEVHNVLVKYRKAFSL